MIDEVALNVKLARHERSIKRLRKWCVALEQALQAHQRVHMSASAQNTLSMSPGEEKLAAQDAYEEYCVESAEGDSDG